VPDASSSRRRPVDVKRVGHIVDESTTRVRRALVQKDEQGLRDALGAAEKALISPSP